LVRTSNSVILLLSQAKEMSAVLMLISSIDKLLWEQLSEVSASFLPKYNSLSLLLLQISPVRLVKNSIPVKSAMPWPATSMVPLKAVASTTEILESASVLTSILANSRDLKIESGRYTFFDNMLFEKADTVMVATAKIVSTIFFISAFFMDVFS
jgi:hypothetical protein